jgi:hypothetical protein
VVGVFGVAMAKVIPNQAHIEPSVGDGARRLGRRLVSSKPAQAVDRNDRRKLKYPCFQRITIGVASQPIESTQLPYRHFRRIEDENPFLPAS